MAARFLTVGHSNHAIGRFVAMLQDAGAGLVADVRSRPYSRFAPHFNRKSLAEALAQAGIGYAWLGDDLGGRPDLPTLGVDGRHKYETITTGPEFARGLARLEALAAEATVCLMCKERDVNACHRGLMIAPALRARGHALAHIAADGSVRPDDRLF